MWSYLCGQSLPLCLVSMFALRGSTIHSPLFQRETLQPHALSEALQQSTHKTKHLSTNILYFYFQDLGLHFCKNLVFNQNRTFIMNKPACSLWTWRRQPWVWRRFWEALDWLACSPSGSCRGSWCGGKAHHRCLTPEEKDRQSAQKTQDHTFCKCPLVVQLTIILLLINLLVFRSLKCQKIVKNVNPQTSCIVHNPNIFSFLS